MWRLKITKLIPIQLNFCPLAQTTFDPHNQIQNHTIWQHCSEGENSDNCGNYVELVNLLWKYDYKLAHHFEIGTVYSGLSSHIQKKLDNLNVG